MIDGVLASLKAQTERRRGEAAVPRPTIALPNPLVVSALLVLGDCAVLAASVGLATGLRILLTSRFPIGIGPSIFLGVYSVAVLLPLGYWFAGLYPGYGRTAVERLRARILVTAVGFGALVLFDYLAQNGQWSRGILIGAATIVLVVMPIWDAVARRWLMATRWWGVPAVVWGPPERRATVIRALAENRELGWLPAAEGDRPVDGAALPGIALAIVVLPRHGVAMPTLADDLPYRRVVLVPEMAEMQSLWVSVRDISSHLGLEMQRNLLLPANRALKRALDIVVALLVLPPALPVILLAAALVRLASPGPAFFTQSREGLGGRPFRIWKLRTMVPGAERGVDRVVEASPANRAEWTRSMKLTADPRIIPGIGAFLRRFSIDELPQLWNVLRGDMSLIGPRPLPDYHLQALEPDAYRLRRRVRPGITGLWQVSGRSDRSLAEQQRLDAYYVRNWSFWLDLHILGRTLLEVLRGNGAR